jgi:GYF domain 2
LNERLVGGGPQVEWYLAREGQQYGPLTNVEMQKLIELGHLRPTDLIWRQGFPDWRPAPVVFPVRPAPQAQPTEPPRSSAPARPAPRRQPPSPTSADHPAVGGPQSAAAESRRAAGVQSAASQRELHLSAAEAADRKRADRTQGARPRHVLRWLLRAATVLAIAAGSGWLIVTHHDKLPGFASLDPASPGPPATISTPPFGGSADAVGTIDQTFQGAELWRIIKQEFPEWYWQRLKEVAKLKSEQREDAAIAKFLAEAVATLRRKHADQALAASPTTLRMVAGAFLDNLKHLSKYGVDACYGFISQGAMSAAVLPLLSIPEHSEHLQRQATVIFEAVAEGRKSPQTHLPPRKDDYEVLTRVLSERGWSQMDLQLFTDPRALGRADPEQVCKMVQDWFAAQLAITEPEIQARLLFQSLRPVVAG